MNKETGYVPTIVGTTFDDNGELMEMETLDPREESNIVSTEDGLVRKWDTLSEEQKDGIRAQR